MVRVEKIKLVCHKCGTEFLRYASTAKSATIHFCKKLCQQTWIAESRAKRLDCKICGELLKLGEGWSGKKKKNKHFKCDRCVDAGLAIKAAKAQEKRTKVEDRARAIEQRMASRDIFCDICKKKISSDRIGRGCRTCNARCAATLSERQKMQKPKHRLNGRMRNAINRTLRGEKNRRGWCSLVGYTGADLMRHLEKKFLPGMSWDNIGDWHIDHIIPISAHNYKDADDPDFKRAWRLENLQPLWAQENRVKHARLSRPHQPLLLRA